MPHLLEYGSHIINLVTPLIGGVGGGPGGVAVVSVAERLMGAAYFYATYHYLSITHIKWTNNSDPWGMYVLAMAGQAMARNSHIVWTGDPFNVNGSGTLENLYEVAGHAIHQVSVWLPAAHDGQAPPGCLPVRSPCTPS